MRNSIRGWRSARAMAPRDGVAAAMPTPPGLTAFAQQPLKVGLGLAALVLYLWIIHSYKLRVGDVAVLALGVGTLIRGVRLRVPAPLWCFLGLIAWMALGLLITPYVPLTLQVVLDMAKVWLIAFFMVNVIRSPAELRFVVIAWLGIFALYPVRGALYNQYICRCTTQGRVSWNFVFENPNDLAALALIPLGLAAALASVEREKWVRYCAYAGLAILPLLIMLTQSRGVMLALVPSAMLLPILSKRKTRDFLVLAALIGVAAVVAPKGVWKRLAGLTNASVTSGMEGVDAEGSAQARWKIWQVAGQTIKENPLLGVGAGIMPFVHAQKAYDENMHATVRGMRDTHSTYLRLAADTGIPGALLYVTMWGSLFAYVHGVRRRLWHVRPADGRFLFFLELSMISYSFASIFGSYGTLSFSYLMVSLIWVATNIMERETWFVPQPRALSLPARRFR